MGGTLPAAAPQSSGVDGQVLRKAKVGGQVLHLKKNPDRNVQRITFRDLAKFVWPIKTDKHLSHLTGYDERTCRRWLCNATEPPAEALSIILCEIMRRFHER